MAAPYLLPASRTDGQLATWHLAARPSWRPGDEAAPEYVDRTLEWEMPDGAPPSSVRCLAAVMLRVLEGGQTTMDGDTKPITTPEARRWLKRHGMAPQSDPRDPRGLKWATR